MFICGDINIDLKKFNQIINDYLNLLAYHDFSSCINGYTRIDKNCKSNLDHIFIKQCPIENMNAYILKIDITDHFATIVNINYPNVYSKIDNIDKSKIKKYLNNEHLNFLIKVENWVEILSNKDVNNNINALYSKINEIVEASCTYYISKHKKRTTKLKEWITLGLVTSIKTKGKLFSKIR